MSGKKCQQGCTCRRHTVSEESRARRSESMKSKWRDPTSLLNTEETRQKMIQGIKNHWTEENRQKTSQKRRGHHDGVPTKGSLDGDGYKILCNQYDHPLARNGQLEEHRKVLYDKIGPGPHYCHWNCGKLLEWRDANELISDHLNGDKLNNDPENLVPSCRSCNVARARRGNPIDWRSTGE